MAVENVLAQRSKEHASWTAQVTIISEHVSINAAEPDSFSRKIL